MSLSIQNLSKRFKNDLALDDVSLETPEGGVTVLFGPSGAGKTVLLRCVAGAVTPDAGTILLNGRDMTDAAPEDRGVGMAFQNFALFPHMTAFNNIASPLKARREKRPMVKEKVEQVAALLKIGHVLDHTPKALSNGQKQRTALARALAASPRVLLLDDPLRNVDAKLRFEMRLELPRLLAERRAATLYVTQDYKEAMALGDRIAVLIGGRIVQEGTPEDIYLRPATVTIARLFGDPAINLLEVVPETDADGVFVRLSERRIALPTAFAAAAGRPCLLGLRPEALAFTEAEDGLPVEIEAETPLNEKIVTLLHTSGHREMLISRPSGAPGPAEGMARIAVSGQGMVLFDRETGAAVAAQEAAA